MGTTTLALVTAVPIVLLVVVLISRWALLALLSLAYMVVPWAGVAGIGLADGLATVSGAARGRAGRLTRTKTGIAFVSIIVAISTIAGASSVWSPVPAESITAALRWLAYLSLTAIAYSMLVQQGYRILEAFGVAMTPLVLLQSASVIVFRFDPSLERFYYQSQLSTLFLNDAGQQMYVDPKFSNNVLDLERAGGLLFISCNRAALAMGVMLVFYLMVGVIRRKTWAIPVVVLLATSIAVGGSKTGLALLLLLPLTALLLGLLVQADVGGARLFYLLGAIVALGVGIQVFVTYADQFVADSAATLEPRLVLWSEALGAIYQNPLLGLGFGGWVEYWLSGQVTAPFTARPAHNWILQSWLDAGLLYFLAQAALVLFLCRCLVKGLSPRAPWHVNLPTSLCGAGLLWCVIHGLGDNTAVIGDPQSLPFMAILTAALILEREGYLEPFGQALDLSHSCSSAATGNVG